MAGVRKRSRCQENSCLHDVRSPVAEEHHVVGVDVLYRGFRGAFDRFMETGRVAGEPAGALIPLYETLNWATTLDKRLAWDAGAGESFDWSWRKEYTGGNVVSGVRFARNRVHHQWAEALYVTPGAQFPMQFPLGFFEWRWRSELPPGENDRGQSEYGELLADQPARITLPLLDQVFAQAVRTADSFGQ
jgi:hypothetical protein